MARFRQFTFIFFCLLLVAPTAFSIEGFRDFYAEPGLRPQNLVPSEDPTESIDHFSGNIQRKYVDLSIPGNGGLDINVTRFYNLPQGAPSYQNPYGYGWTMHFGRITTVDGAWMLCGDVELTVPPSPTGILLQTSQFNPTIEFPSGGREMLVHSKALNDGTFITKSNWKAECVNPDDYLEGLIAYSPDGTKYEMTERAYVQGEETPGESAPFVETFFTKRIEDTYGNWLEFSYLELQNGMKVVSDITSSDGRVVNYTYRNAGGAIASSADLNVRLDTITANGQTWQYNVDVEGTAPSTGWGAVESYKLNSVERPDGLLWQYEYGSTVGEPSFGRMTKATNPSGGEVAYTYQLVRPYQPNANFKIVAIESKTKTVPNGQSGTWTYTFNFGSTDFASLSAQGFSQSDFFDEPGRRMDETVVTTPDGVEKSYHYGYWYVYDSWALFDFDVLWKTGFRVKEEFYDGAATSPTEMVAYRLSPRQYSDQTFESGVLTASVDARVWTPELRSERRVINGAEAYESYGYDEFGSVTQTYERRTLHRFGDGNKLTDYRYTNDTSNWFIGLRTRSDVDELGTPFPSVGSLSWSYNANGRLATESRFGVVTKYTHTSEGDVSTIEDARGNVTTYSNYFRGMPQSELYADSTSISRVVNPTGTVQSVTSARSNTTAYTYDDLNRLTSIDFPLGDDVSISWATNRKTLTRGAFRETADWDGFNRITSLRREDTSTGSTVLQTNGYDVFGRKTFASLPNSSSGVNTTYDTRGRPLTITNPDGTSRNYIYKTHEAGGHGVDILDENNHLTSIQYLYIGLTDRYILNIFSPEDVGTAIHRDLFGKLKSVTQGQYFPDYSLSGLQHTYSYDNNHFLWYEDQPSVGRIDYVRDEVGNMTRRTVGGVYTRYFYDSMNRVTDISYADADLKRALYYDDDGNLERVWTPRTVREYDYDANGNLYAESLRVGVNTYSTTYFHNDLDHVRSIDYPSGREVTYDPDALGRPTQAAPYVSAVSYFPSGTPERITYGNNRETIFTQDNRLRIEKIQTGTLASLDYAYDPSGNVQSITDLINSTNNRTMSYDALNRLSGVTSGLWGTATYTYDYNNNLETKADPKFGTTLIHQNNGGYLVETTNSSNGRKQRYSYDSRGNISGISEATYDASDNPITVYRNDSFYFDDASQLASVWKSSYSDSDGLTSIGPSSFEAIYDGEGHRAQRYPFGSPDEYTNFAHSHDGFLMGEYSSAGPEYGYEYIYLGRQMVASHKLNSPPVFGGANPYFVEQGQSVTLSASVADIEESDLTWEWTQIDGPIGTIDDSSAESIVFTAPAGSAGGVATIQFTATDDRGGEVLGNLTINMTTSNTLPTISITSPADGSSVVYPAALEFTGFAGDTEDGDLTNQIQWFSDRNGQFSFTGSGWTASYLPAGVHVITAQVTDSLGGTAADVVTVNIYEDGDNTPPTVSITSPTAGTTFTRGTSALYATAYDSEQGTISSQIVWSSNLDGEFGEESEPDTSVLRPGTHIITAQVTDSEGFTGADSVWANVNDRPTVTILSPSDGTTLTEGDLLTLTGVASDFEDGDLSASIQWEIEGEGGLFYDTGATVSGIQLNPGTYDVKAIVIDTNGGLTSSEILITIEPLAANNAPALSLLSPLDGTSYTVGDSVTLTGTATDTEDGDLSAGISWSSDQDGPLGMQPSISWTTLSVNTHVITASVTDSGGLTEIAAVTITINPVVVNMPPTVSISTPANGAAFVSGASISLAGIANDTEDGDLSSSIEWISDLDGSLGTADTLNISTLSAGTHVITASVTDSGSAQIDDSVSILIVNPLDDTDSDGLPDGWELSNFGDITSNSGSDDPDNDGISNALEYADATDPNVPDVGSGDGDGDGIDDVSDNCPTVANPNQADVDGDSVGNVCDVEYIVLTSVAAEDGYIREQNEAANVGGRVWATSSGRQSLRFGDDGQDRQYKSILSFDPSTIPENTEIVEASVALVATEAPTSNRGDVSALGTVEVAMQSGSFGGSSALEVTDFEAIASVSDAGIFTAGYPAAVDINAAGVSAISTALANGDARVQVRLSYSADDNDNGTQDSLGFYASDVGNAASRPTLTVGYLLDDTVTADQPPAVTITAPVGAPTVGEGTDVTLSATASDPEDGDVSASMAWSSDIDGAIGSGASIVLNTLSPGTHTLSASATDSFGNTAADTATITIESTADGDSDGIADGVDNCPSIVNPNQGDADSDGIGNVCDPEQLVLTSIAAEDGYVRETNATSGVGGTVTAGASGKRSLRFGDDTSDRQFKMFLSFDPTSIPIDATISDAAIELVRTGSSNVGDVSALGAVQVDLASGVFGATVALESQDFESTATAADTGAFVEGNPAAVTLSPTGVSVIESAVVSSASRVQVRFSFENGDSGNAANDYLGYYSSNNGTASRHPTITITYTLSDSAGTL